MDGVLVVGGGLAGVEAAWALANRGINVTLAEMKPKKHSPAHKTDMLAELVCSNSLKAQRVGSAAGLLKAEMERLGSICVECAKKCSVPAGGALAVDRDKFSAMITEKIKSHPLITLECREITEIPDGNVIIAAGPLASDALADSIKELCGGSLSFFDAAAPIVTDESIDKSCAFTQSRYDRGGEDDYLNCPMNKEEYESFYNELVNAETAELHSFDKKKGVYEGCMPIEVMAARGADTMRFGPLKPVGLRDPRTGHRPWAVLQLRREDSGGTMYNLVGFQTNLTFGEQKRVFSMIPALRNAEFVRYGVMHRNTFLESPRVLNAGQYLNEHPNVFFAGQITGFEGYMESAASGLLAARQIFARLNGRELPPPPPATMCGALLEYITTPNKDFQPMGANMGILPRTAEIDAIRDKRERYAALSRAAQDAMNEWVKEYDV